jgi:hypothetical protein
MYESAPSLMNWERFHFGQPLSGFCLLSDFFIFSQTSPLR